MDTVVLEGNGQRPSHMGDGWRESDKMYTLNTTEVHAVAYRIEGVIKNETTPKVLEGEGSMFTLTSTDYKRGGSMVLIYETDSSAGTPSERLKIEDR